MMVRVQQEDFEIDAVIRTLRENKGAIGAVATFLGVMRDMNLGDSVEEMWLEHYPGMTEKALETIAEQAKQRWSVIDLAIIHRVGLLKPCDQIVLVAVVSAHREDALSACNFIMDYLKTDSPFWKKERTEDGERWLDQREKDIKAHKKWEPS